ncbi:MAG: SbcC/MukB-like Walker B domain-containing protein, partial [Bacteroidales bacterium]
KAEEAKLALTQATDEFNSLSSRLKSLSGDIVSASKDVSAKRGSLLMAESQAVIAVGAFGLKLSSENIVELLKSLKNDFSRRKEADAKAFSDANLLRKNYDSAKTALDKLADELASKEKVCQSIVDKSSALENDRKISFNSSELALKDVSGALSKLEELVTFPVEWKNVDLAQLRDVISKSAKEYARDKESGEKLALSLADAQKNIDSASSEIEALKHIFPSSVSLAPVSSSMQSASAASSSVSLVSRGVEVKNLNLSLSAFVTEVRSLTAVIGSTEAQLSGTAEKIRGYLELHPDMSEERLVVLSAISDADASKIRQWLEKLNNAVVGFEAQYAQINSQLAAHQKIKPMISAEATYDSLSSDRAAVAAAAQLNNEQRVEKETIVKRNAENVAKVAQKKARLDFLRAENARWNELDSVFGGSDGMRFKRIAQSYVLRALLVKANYYLRQLFNRYELECADGQLAINVIDHAQGNYVRNVSSLSGGESFIVSLALALGLSSINKDKINVDTLFIDEGFGTLSDDYLDSVIDVLDRLYQISGRKVGLISHVSKLRERIPTQIQLTRTGSNSSSVKIVNI